MKDEIIIQMFLERNEDAIAAVINKYGHYCQNIAGNILGNSSDIEECLNDTYLKVWKSIPPHQPDALAAYIGKIARNSAINIMRYNKAEKRNNGEVPFILDELEDFVPGGINPEDESSRGELVSSINSFLSTLSQEKRVIFVSRYWYSASISDIASKTGISQNKVSVTLSRLRKQLKVWLTERGFNI